MVGLLTRYPKSQCAIRLPKYLHTLKSIEKMKTSLSLCISVVTAHSETYFSVLNLRNTGKLEIHLEE